ncbi:type IV toxin-antitoxin system AbiEi family antitoxin [Nocardioides pacificus]
MDERFGLRLPDDFPLPATAPFTRAQARQAGVTDRSLSALCDARLLWRPIHGVYLPTQAGDTLHLRVAALRLVVPADAFITDHTAAWLWAGERALAPNSHRVVPPVSMFRPADAGRLRNKLAASGERTLAPQDLREVHGLRVTTPLRTALDLGRLQSRVAALAGMDAMLSLGDFTHGELMDALSRFARQRGVVQLRILAPRADGRAASWGESGLRGHWYDAGLPRPELQICVQRADGGVFFLDMGLEELLFAAEYDGERWHSDPADMEYDAQRRAWLAAEAGWRIEVFGRAHVFGQSQDAFARLAAAYRDVCARHGSPVLLR